MAKTLAIILGVVFVVLSLLAFIANPLIGTSGYFVTGVTLDIVYLLFGIILLIAAGAGDAPAALWLKVIGVLSLVLFIDGLFQSSALLGFITANYADAWLNLVLGVVSLGGAYMKGGSDSMQVV